MSKEEAWKQIIEKRGQIAILQREIELLKRKAVLELRKVGYSHDKICGILGIGKITSIKLTQNTEEKKE